MPEVLRSCQIINGIPPIEWIALLLFLLHWFTHLAQHSIEIFCHSSLFHKFLFKLHERLLGVLSEAHRKEHICHHGEILEMKMKALRSLCQFFIEWSGPRVVVHLNRIDSDCPLNQFVQLIRPEYLVISVTWCMRLLISDDHDGSRVSWIPGEFVGFSEDQLVVCKPSTSTTEQNYQITLSSR